MSKVILSNGDAFVSDFCYPSGTQLLFTAFETSFFAAADLLDNMPSDTAKISFRGENGYEAVYDGYTTLVSLVRDGDHLLVTMGRES